MESGTVKKHQGWKAVRTTRHNASLAVVAHALMCVAAPVDAALMTYDVTFSAGDFQGGSNPPVYNNGGQPFDPVTGSFTITFDPTFLYIDSTSGITLNSLNIVLGSALSFSYDPSAGTFPAGTLRVGGAQAGSDVIFINPSSDDFWLYINDFTGIATFQQLGYSQTAHSGANLFYTVGQTGAANATLASSSVPEPVHLPVLCLALIGLASTRSYRRRQLA